MVCLRMNKGETKAVILINPEDLLLANRIKSATLFPGCLRLRRSIEFYRNGCELWHAAFLDVNSLQVFITKSLGKIVRSANLKGETKAVISIYLEDLVLANRIKSATLSSGCLRSRRSIEFSRNGCELWHAAFLNVNSLQVFITKCLGKIVRSANLNPARYSKEKLDWSYTYKTNAKNGILVHVSGRDC